MSDAAVAEQIVAIATITADRGASSAVVYEQVAVAIATAEQGVSGPPGPPGRDGEGAAATDDGFF